MKTAHLLDISAVFFRYYFAPGAYIENEEGWDVSALKSTVRWLCQKPFFEADVVVAAFDESLGSGFRHEIDEDYKANRPMPTDDIIYQLTALKHVCEHLGFNVFASDDLEADDLIASSIEQLSDHACVIHSRDKDLRQLLKDNVVMLDPVSKKQWDVTNFEEEMAISPEQVPLYLALMGDTSDNIVGLPGIGDKSARRLLGYAWDLPELLVQAQQPEQSGWSLRGAKRIAETVLEYAELIEHNLSLTKLVCDANLNIRQQTLTELQAITVEALCTQFGIRQGMDKSIERINECIQ